ncbi:hypothetical protein M406DRAFT_320856 [Cryphonectria parasitica EP155]|uniref:Uncharacterized protein n=1 Tax=Cryphonectria parasitica (strain ATCC 38755 / EP155) TaxID=660469 RepID=A0A9P4Y986_CRYP1|nr:uncharacterized protein M406DRAFT_320856 [Cryphonectria parasitica EP155]KAF3768390.1 hypothetical protein M406DRAFT_320856 [Cryphonectria parasitica EP155]
MLQGLGGNERIESRPPVRPGDGDGELSPSPPSPSALQHKQQQQQQPKRGFRHRAGQPPQPACTALDGVRGAKIAKARRKRGPRGPEASARLLSAAQQAPSGLKPPVPPPNALSTASVRRSRRLEEKAQSRAAAGLGARDR